MRATTLVFAALLLAGCMGPTPPQGLPAMWAAPAGDAPAPPEGLRATLQEGGPGSLDAGPWTPLECDDRAAAQRSMARLPFDANATLAAANAALGLAPDGSPGNGRWDGGAWRWALAPAGTAYAAREALAWEFPWQGGAQATRDLLQRVVAALALPAALRVEANVTADGAAAHQAAGGRDVASIVRLHLHGGRADLWVGSAWPVPGGVDLPPVAMDRLGAFLDCRFGDFPGRTATPLQAWRLSVEGGRLAWSVQRSWRTESGGPWLQGLRVDAATGAVLDAVQELGAA